MPKILVVDDETVITAQLEEHLTFMGYEVVGSAACGEEAVNMARDLTPDIILMDIVMLPGGLDGIDAAAMIQAEQDIPVIFLTAFADNRHVERARHVEPFGYILKPFQEREVKACIEVALHKKKIERKLRESEERHRSVVETAGEAIVIVDSRDNIVSWNRAAETMFGYARVEAAGRPFTRMIPEGLRKEIEDEMHQIVATGQSARFERKVEYSGLRKDGCEFPMEFFLTTWNTREEIFCTMIMADISERKRIEEALRASEQQLRVLNASKNKFFSIIAHDLKNPLMSFLAFADLLKDFNNWEEEQIEKYTRQFRDSAENLAALLENLLTWSKIQRGLAEYQPQQIAINHIVAWSIQLLKPHAEQKQITLRNSIQEEIPVSADVNMVDTVIRNLISNALKFTNSGDTVDVSARQAAHNIEVSVSDTGIGIPEKKLPQLFRIEAKTQRTGTAGEKGTGLGLILCKEFVEQHGGGIWVASEVGKGTTFTFSLPKIPVE